MSPECRFLWWTCLAAIFYKIGDVGCGSVKSLYLQSSPFAWDGEKFVIYVSFSSCLGVISFALAKLFQMCGARQHWIIYFSLFVNVAYQGQGQESELIQIITLGQIL